MNEDYLWDRSGPVDPEISGLEKLLGSFRHQRKVRRQWPIWGLAAVAAVLLAIYLRPGQLTAWELSLENGKPVAVRSGQIIETGTIRSQSVGQVSIEPNSRLRLVGSKRLALDHGTIHAFIWAPPTDFVVDTPAATTVDLGCQYTLTVARDGTGFLSVETGWVAFETRGIESFIPAGAVCVTHRGRIPGTPHYKDAPEPLAKSLAEFDRTHSPAALQNVLETSRPADAFTVWHLLQRTSGDDRARVFERFADIVTLPSNVTRDRILAGDRVSMDAAWNKLGLGDMAWWRRWKGRQ